MPGTDVRELLEQLADRGEHRGAEAVIDAAFADVADHRLIERPLSPSPRRRRWSLRRRLAVFAAAVVLVSVAVVGAGVVYVREKLDDVTTVGLGGALAEGGAATPSGPMTVLLVGSDRRPGIDGVRADTIMVLRLDPHAGRAAVLSIPRDLWVPIAGQARDGRVNTALQAGPEVQLRTVSELLGVPIDHYVEVGFDGFRHLVDVLGGVEVAFPVPGRDVTTGLDVPTSGCVRLGGDQALALVRSRRFEYLEAGRWRQDPTSDLGRIQRQQEFVLQVFRQVAATSNPLTLNRMLDVAVDQVTIDDALDIGDLVALARTVRGFPAEQIVFGTIPTTTTVIDGASVLTSTSHELDAAADRLLGRAVPQATGPAPPTTGGERLPDC